MAKKRRDVPIYGRATPFIRHSHVVLDVPVLGLNLSNITTKQGKWRGLLIKKFQAKIHSICQKNMNGGNTYSITVLNDFVQQLPASRITPEKSKGHNLRKPSSDPVTQKASFTDIQLMPIPNSLVVPLTRFCRFPVGRSRWILWMTMSSQLISNTVPCLQQTKLNNGV